MSMRLARILVGPMTAAAGTLFALGASPASASPAIPQYGPGPCTVNVSVSPHTVGPGQSVTVTITGTCDGDTFTVTIHSTPETLGTMTTDANGNVTGSFKIPTDLSPGQHTLTIGDVSGNAASVSIVVTGQPTTGPAASAPPSHLPLTGTDAGMLGGIGATAVGTGGLLVLATRKRRRSRFR